MNPFCPEREGCNLVAVANSCVAPIIICLSPRTSRLYIQMATKTETARYSKGYIRVVVTYDVHGTNTTLALTLQRCI